MTRWSPAPATLPCADRLGPPSSLRTATAVQLIYLISTLVLRRCLARLTRSDTEELMVVSGLEHRHLRIPQTGFCPRYSTASAVDVAAEPSSALRILRYLERHEHRVLALFHSHPGTGPSAVCESATDIANQARFEAAGYAAITGIFSRDGYIRFFANDLHFSIRLYGAGITEVAHHVFRLR